MCRVCCCDRVLRRSSELRHCQHGDPPAPFPQRLSFAKGKSEAVARLEFGTKKSKKDRKAAKDAAEGAAANGAAGDAARAAPAAPAPPRAAEDAGEPNETLFVQNLPEATTSEMLSMLFSQYTG